MSISTITFGGQTFRASTRTIAHLKYTRRRLFLHFPWARLVVIQPCYNTGVAASAGTHDYDAVLDVRIVGLPWWRAQGFLRRSGWAAWYRHTGAWANAEHIHMVSIPAGIKGNYPTEATIKSAFLSRVGIYVPAQVDDYYAHALGLKGEHRAGIDTSWHPQDISKTLFRQTRGA